MPGKERPLGGASRISLSPFKIKISFFFFCCWICLKCFEMLFPLASNAFIKALLPLLAVGERSCSLCDFFYCRAIKKGRSARSLQAFLLLHREREVDFSPGRGTQSCSLTYVLFLGTPSCTLGWPWPWPRPRMQTRSTSSQGRRTRWRRRSRSPGWR